MENMFVKVDNECYIFTLLLLNKKCSSYEYNYCEYRTEEA